MAAGYDWGCEEGNRTLSTTTTIRLPFGDADCFECALDVDRVAGSPQAPAPLGDVAGELRAALAAPLDFPPLAQAVIPGDRVALALDRDTPAAAALIAEIWQVLRQRDVDPGDVTIVQPAALSKRSQRDPRGGLPEDVRGRVEWKVHDPLDSNACGYLASTADGERIYLAREVTEADVVVSVGQVAFDPLLGCRGTSSVFYPGLSRTESLEQAHGQGHRELGPDDERPLRQLIDEIAWMLGTQFSVQVVAAGGDGAAAVLAGAVDSVLQRGKQFLSQHWLLEVETRPEIVLAAVDRDAAGHGWAQVGAALAAAMNLVAAGGKIVILSGLAEEPGPGMELVRESESPRDALQPLRTFLPPDLIAATQLAAAADWADVYLLSRLEDDLVEDLFLIPLGKKEEAARLLRGDESCLFLPSAQHMFGRVGSAGESG